MTLQQLKYIVAIDRYRSFAKAADACGISPLLCTDYEFHIDSIFE